MAYGQLTDTFVTMMKPATAVHFEMFMAVIQGFVVVMYDRTSSAMNVGEARLHLLAQKGWAIEAIPPTESALLKHKGELYTKAHWYREML